MAMAQDLDIVFHVKQSLFGGGQVVAAREEIACQGLCVSTEERPPRAEWLTEEVASARCFGKGKRKRRLIGLDLRVCCSDRLGIAGLHL